MNNQQDNLNVNLQMNNDNQTGTRMPIQDNQNTFSQNTNEPLNVIPEHVTFTNQNNNIQTNQTINLNNNINNNQNDYYEENPMLMQQTSRFFNNDIDRKSTTLNNLEDMNVEGEYNDMPKVDYTLDPKVQANLREQNEPQKNTITITAEMKVFIIIFIVLLIFVFIAPTIYDYIRNIK